MVRVQRALRRANTTTTLNPYSHLGITAEDRMRNAAGSMLAHALREEPEDPRTVCELDKVQHAPTRRVTLSRR